MGNVNPSEGLGARGKLKFVAHEPEFDVFTEGVIPGNLFWDAYGQPTVKLWDRWGGMIQDFRALGKVLVITRNSHAVLGEYREYPEFSVDRDEVMAGDLSGDMSFCFSAWDRAMARCERRPMGMFYAVEFVDRRGHALHRVCLTAESDVGRFMDWVQLHQGWGDGILQQEWRASSDKCSFKIRPPEGVLVEGARFIRALGEIFEKQIPLQVAVSNSGVMHRALFYPNELHEMGKWWFLCGGDCGIHLLWDERMRIVGRRLSGESPGSWMISLSPRGGEVALELSGYAFPSAFEDLF